MNFLKNLYTLYLDMSFYLVIGMLLTGILHVFVKKEVILKHIGDDSILSVIKASILGVPLPICSCGVVPTAMYLGKNGASKGAVVSFLTSTPQTGIDSIIATYGLLGPVFAIYRAIVAFLSGIFSGIITDLFCKNDKINYDSTNTSCGCSSKRKTSTSCGCSHNKNTELKTCGCSHKETNKVVDNKSCSCSTTVIEESPKETCCCSNNSKKVVKESKKSCSCSHKNNEKENTTPETLGSKIKAIFLYSFGEFLDDISVNFIIGLVIAALISSFIPVNFVEKFSNPLIIMILMIIIGIPMYVCSTASIPIAVSLIAKGISPGAAFVFLFAGPITNIASLAILGKTLGKKVISIYLGSVAFCAIVFGLAFDYIINFFDVKSFSNMTCHSHEEPKLYIIIVSALFGLLLIKSLYKKIKLKFI